MEFIPYPSSSSGLLKCTAHNSPGIALTTPLLVKKEDKLLDYMTPLLKFLVSDRTRIKLLRLFISLRIILAFEFLMI